MGDNKWERKCIFSRLCSHDAGLSNFNGDNLQLQTAFHVSDVVHGHLFRFLEQILALFSVTIEYIYTCK